MLLFIRVSRCTQEVHLSKLKLTKPRMLWLDHRLTPSAALRRKRQPTVVKSSPAFPLSSPRANMSVLPFSPLRGFSILHSHSPTGQARTLTHTPVAFASSASSPTPAESVKEAHTVQTPSTLPLEDVKRLLHLAHPERWSLAGKLCVYCISPICGLAYRYFLVLLEP